MVKRIIEILFLLILLAVFIYLGRPRIASYFYNQGCSYYDRGLYGQAAIFFQKALKIAPDIATIHYTLANTYIEEKMTDKAIDEYEEAIRVDPGYVAAYLAISKIYSSQERYDQAIEELKKINDRDPSNLQIKDALNNVSFTYMAVCFDQATELFVSGDRDKAYNLLYKALAINSDLAFVYYTLGYFYFMDKNYVLSEESLNKTLQKDPEFWLAYKLKGDIYAAEDKYEKAIAEYKKAIALNKNDSVLYNNLGLMFMEIENYSEAVVYLEQALRLSPNDIDLRYNLASVYRDNQMLDQAVSEYQRLIQQQPEYPNVHNDLGDIYKFQGNNTGAYNEYRKEMDYCQERLLDNPDDPVSLNDLAYAINGIGEEVDKAKEIITKVLNIHPDYQQAYITLAKIYENKREINQSLSALVKGKELSKNTKFIDTDINRLKNDIKAFNRYNPDTVYLKNGRQISGKIKEQDENKIILEINLGGSSGNVTFYRDSVERIGGVSEDIWGN